MKTKSSNSSASLGKRKDTDSIFRGSKLTISRSMYKRLLRLGVIALATGSPLLISGCDPKSEIKIANSLLYSNDSVGKPNTYGIATDSITTGHTSAAQTLCDIFDYLGIPAVKLASDIKVSEVIKNGDIIKFGYHDDFYNTDLQFAINEELSTKDTLVFDGTSKNSEFGTTSYRRYKYSSTADGVVVQELITKRGKPPSENTGWEDNGTLKYIPQVDGVKEYQIFDDGTERYNCKIVPKDKTTVSKIYTSSENVDYNLDWSNMSLSKLNNLDTGLHDVHM
ncbi:MAG: hypothetical protein WCK78_15755 [Paludibacter sp.]